MTTAQSTGAPLTLDENDPADAVAALHRAATRFPTHGTTTVDGPTVHRTYPELLRRASELLTGLRAHGLRPGDPVVLHGLPLADFFPSLWACLLGGLVPAPVAEPWTPDAPAERLAHLCELLDGPLVLTGTAAPLRAVTATFGAHRPTAVTSVADCTGPAATDPHTPAPDDLAVLILSSGSTGPPKAVRLTHHALAVGAASFRRALDLQPAHVTLNWLPVDHSGALILYHLNEVFAGATNVHVPTETVLGNPSRWLDLLAEHRVNHTWSPMFGYQLVTDALASESRHWDLSALVTLLCGGEQVIPRGVTDFLAATAPFGVRPEHIVPAWGMAETTSAVTFGRFTAPGSVLHVAKASLGGDLHLVDETTDERDRVTFATAGSPAPGVTVRVVDHDDQPLPPHRIGRLQVSADRLMAGYLNNPEADRALFPAGRDWLDSGDLAFLSAGAVVLTGRAKDIIILNGHNHFCHDIEDVVRATGLGADGVAACGVPDPATGTEQLVVFVVSQNPDPADERVIRRALFDRLRLGRARVVFLPAEEFPRTPSGKVRRAELRDRFTAGRYDGPPARDLAARVREIVSAVLGHDADPHTPFYELGLTSVALARTRARLADELDITVAPTTLFRYPTVAELAAHLTSAPAAPPEETVPTAPAQDRRVAIIGMAIRFPGATTLDEYWANLRAGVDSVQTFDAGGDPDRRPVSGVLTDVDAFDETFFGVSPREAELTDPAHRLFLECTHHALEHAGYAGQERGYRVGVFAGSGMNLYGHQDTATATPDAADALAATIGTEPDFLATRVAYRLGLTGPAIGVQTACSTSLVAVHLAAQAVLNGDADIAVAGAAAVRVPQETGYRHQPGSILSPTGQCRAFDTSADGTVGGNGVAAVVLKPLQAALADGDPVHAVILGSAVNNDGRGKVGFTAPSAPGQVAVIRQALDRAGVTADTISYVEAHGTGTELGDAVEVEALREAFGTAGCWMGSVKPNVGHLDSCAGMAGLVKVVLMLRHRELAPTIHVTNPAVPPPFSLVTSRREWTVPGVRRAGVSAFGVGGTNAHVIVEEAPAVVVPPVAPTAVLMPLSATDPTALAELTGRLRAHLLANPALRAIDVARTLAEGRRHLPVRQVAVGTDAVSLAAALTSPTDVTPLGPLGFAFSGQGVTRPGVGAGLYAAFPVVRKVLDTCADALGVHNVLDPPVPQATTFAVQVALVELWRSVGVTPDFVTGHSLGEYAALYATGSLSLVDGVRLVASRGRVLRGHQQGTMLALNAEYDVAQRIATASGTSLAAVNGQLAHTLSGPVTAIDHAAELAAAESVACRRLDVEEAFHSALVEPALPELRRHLDAVAWQPLRVPFISGLDGRVLRTFDADLLVRQAREPVRFDQVLGTLDALGCRDVVEIGQGKTLSAFGRRGQPASTWLPTLGTHTDEKTAFLTAVGELYREGAEIEWPALAADGARRVPLPQYPFTRTRHQTPASTKGTTAPETTTASTDSALQGVSADGTARAGGDAALQGVSANGEEARAGGDAALLAVSADGDEARKGGDAALRVVTELTARQLGMQPDAIDPDRGFVALGADSLSLMTLVRELAADYETTIPVRQLFTETDTPRKLAALITVPDTPPAQPAPQAAPPPATPSAPQPAPPPAPPPPAPQPAPQAAPQPAPPSAAPPAPQPAPQAAPPPAPPTRWPANSASAAQPPAPPEPPARPALTQPNPTAVSTPPDAVLTVVEQQLALAHQMVDRLTTVMSEQLAAITGTSTSNAAPASNVVPTGTATTSATNGTAIPSAANANSTDTGTVSITTTGTASTTTATATSGTATSGALSDTAAPVTTNTPAATSTTNAATGTTTTSAAETIADTDTGTTSTGAAVNDTETKPVRSQPPAVIPEPTSTLPSQPPIPGAPSRALGPAPVIGSGAACDFSLYFFGDYPDEEHADKYHLITEAARFADRHGFHALWLPERHFHSFGALFPNPSVLAAALATVTDRIRLHAGSVVLPLHHPVRVAEEWSVVDNISHGRAGLCVASGWHATDFVLAPQNFGQHRDLMYTHLDTVRRLWAGDSITAVDGAGQDVDVRLHPKPVQAQPPMYVAVVGNPDSYRLAARHDLGVVTNLMAQDVDQLAANIALYRKTRAEHGLDPAAGRIVVLVHTYLGDDLDTVRRQAYQPFCDYLRSSLSLFNQVTNSLGIDIDLASTPEEDIEFLLERAYARYCESRALIGTVESGRAVVDRLVAAGADEIACFVDFGVSTPDVLSGLSTLDQLRIGYANRQPLTAAEHRIWFLDRLYPGQTIYHEPKAIRLTGPLDAPALQTALQHVVDRQPALRTVFHDDDGTPRRVVLPHVQLDCPILDRTGSTEDAVLGEARTAIQNEVFDLAAGPLLSARLYRLAADRHLLLLNAHHIVFDSSSTAVLLTDLATAYRGESLPALSALPDHTTPVSEEDVERWRAHFTDAPVLRLPTDHPRPPTRSGRGAPWTHELPADLTTQVTDLGRQHGVTPFMTLLAAIAAVLGRFAHQDDFVLGTAVANRPLGTDDRIGLFLDTVALRMDLAGQPTFGELAARIRETTTAAYGQVPFDELVRALNPHRDAGGNPLFQVMVEYENATDVPFAPPLSATALDMPANRAPFDLSLYLTRHAGGVRIAVEYDTDLFTQETIVRLLTLVEETLRRAVQQPGATLSTLTAPTDADRAALAGWQGSAATEHACLHELVERQVDRTPDATALVAGAHTLSYRDLDESANRVAARLIAAGVGRGDLVGANMPRGPELIATLLGILKTGAAYLPLDPTLPAARLEQLIDDSGARLVLRAFPDGLATASTARPDVPVSPEDPAYCIYTSGSTGRPKGVLVPHRGPANTVAWQVRQHAPLRTLQWTSPAFDVSVQEIFSTLAAGASLVLVDDDVRHDPAAVARTIREHEVERIFLPYTPLKYLLDTAPSLPSLRVVVSAGEAMVLTPAVRRFFADHPSCLLYNQYGPTEGSIIVTSQQVDPAGPAIPPIGAPIDGVTVAVLDEHRSPVPVGAVGELFIGGTAVAAGYLHRPEETAAAFVDGLYRTGDLGRWRTDGTIEFLGRRDDQVKIRGHRVEPGETRRAVAELDGVRDSAVIVGRDSAGENELRAYVVSDTEIDVLADRVRTVLPGYLVPTQWVAVDRLPFTANGKLDVSRLPAPSSPTEVTRPATAVEETLHELWCTELGRAEVSVEESFFALGGHSLSAVRLLNRVTARLGQACSMATFFANPTIRALAALITRVVDTAPLTGQQHRLWRRHHELADPAVYNVSHRVDLRGPVDAAALRSAVTTFVARHAALRLRVVTRDGDLVQEVLAPFPVELPAADLTGLTDDAVDQWCQAAADEPFPLDDAPLFRVRLGRRSTDEWVFVLVMHHMVCDGWSLGIMWAELSALYAGAVLPAAPQYPDYVRWERAHLAGPRRAALERFWRTELTGADLTLRLPADRPRPGRLSGRGALHESDLGPELAARVSSAAAKAGTTPYAVLAAAFARWAARRCGQEEVVLPTSTANRVRPEHEQVVGMIGDVVLVRVRPADPEVVRQVAEQLYQALDHQELRLASVVDLIGGEFPNFLFTVVTTPPPVLDLPDITATVRELAAPGTARNELYVRVTLTDNRITVFWEYSTDLFDPPTITQWATELRDTLAELTDTPTLRRAV